MRRKEYRDRQAVTISVEKDIFTDFIDLCDRERKSISLKFSEMMEEELQKNVMGEINPLRIRYGDEQENKPIQGDIRDWLPRSEAIAKARNIPLDARQWDFIAETCRIIARKQRTGYL